MSQPLQQSRPNAGRADSFRSRRYVSGMARLVEAVQELSMAREIETIREIVRHAARDLTGADGATFVLRDQGRCYYVDEDAIAPLWKGKRFPMDVCISGWVMLNRQPVAIEDIYADSRVPEEAYRPTFVKSLAMVPIRTAAPIGAIGNYWASAHRPSSDELKLLQALADSTSVAMENAQVYAELEQRVEERTEQLQAANAELEHANQELEAFSYSVSHDLRAPLRAIDGFGQALVEDYENQLDDQARYYLGRIRSRTQRMDQLIDDLLRLSRIGRAPLHRAHVDISETAERILRDLAERDPEREVDVHVEKGLSTYADPDLTIVLLENLLGNAWKFTAKQTRASIEVGCYSDAEPGVFFVRDNGAGFDMAKANKLFAPFRRLHTERQFEGTGIGLATVQRIVSRHRGRVWAEAEPERGATFFFALGKEP